MEFWIELVWLFEIKDLMSSSAIQEIRAKVAYFCRPKFNFLANPRIWIANRPLSAKVWVLTLNGRLLQLWRSCENGVDFAVCCSLKFKLSTTQNVAAKKFFICLFIDLFRSIYNFLERVKAVVLVSGLRCFRASCSRHSVTTA